MWNFPGLKEALLASIKANKQSEALSVLQRLSFAGENQVVDYSP